MVVVLVLVADSSPATCVSIPEDQLSRRNTLKEEEELKLVSNDVLHASK